MKATICGALLGMSALSFAAGAPISDASITEAVNTVSYQTSPDSPQKTATTGTTIHSNNVVRTGSKSRAALQFNDHTVARMGANSVFSFDSKGQKLNLQEGAMLFCKPKQGSTFDIATPAATCAVTGTTGFLQVLNNGHGKSTFVMGLIEGHTTVTIGGHDYNLTSGNLLVILPNGNVSLLNFDLASFLKKAGLIVQFTDPLPNQAEIDKALARFNSLKKRGFFDNVTTQPPLMLDQDFLNRYYAGQIQGFEIETHQPPPQQQTDNCTPPPCCRPPCCYYNYNRED